MAKDAAFYNRNPIIALDFDGTVVEHCWPEVGPPIPGAIEWLRRIQEAGARIMLWTNRSNQAFEGRGGFLTAAVRYLEGEGIQLWGINKNPEQHTWSASKKQYAHIYVDDAAFGCPLIYPPGRRPYVDWSIVGPVVLERTKEWRARSQW